jgi:AcrR family transcriptional regulator
VHASGTLIGGRRRGLPVASKDGDRTLRYDEMREKIIDIAVGLFARNGYTATGVAELGEAAGLARGALYYYIKSKNSLLSAIHDRVLDPLLAEVDRIHRLDISAPARLTLASELLLNLIVNYRDHVYVFLHEYQHLEGENRRHFREKRAQFEDHIADLVREGNETGFFDVDDVRIATLTWLNTHNYTYQWVRNEPDVSASRLSRTYMEILLKGFSGAPSVYEAIEGEIAEGRRLLTETALPVPAVPASE